MNRSKLRNRYIELPSRENFLEHKKAKKTCNSQTNLQKSVTSIKLPAKVSGVIRLSGIQSNRF